MRYDSLSGNFVHVTDFVQNILQNNDGTKSHLNYLISYPTQSQRHGSHLFVLTCGPAFCDK